MRIGIDAKRAFYNSSGLGNYSRTLLNSLFLRFPEHEYHLYTPGQGKNNNSFEFPAPSSPILIREPQRKIHKILPALWRSKGMLSDLKKDGIELYHGLSNELPLGIEKTKIKSVVTIHDLIFLRYPQFYPSIDVRIYKKKFAHAIRVADRIIAISEQTKKDILEFYQADPGKISVVYQSCAPAFFVSASEQKKASVRHLHRLPESFCLNVGTINERKNLLLILQSLSHMVPASRPHLVVIGQGKQYRKKVEAYIQEEELAEWVHFRSNIPNADLPAIYQQADAFIYPSLFEGFGIPVLEALASGVPVITSNSDTWAEEVGGPESQYVPTDQAKVLASSLLAVLTRSDLREKMIHAGRIHAEKFREDGFAAKMMEIYQDVYSK